MNLGQAAVDRFVLRDEIVNVIRHPHQYQGSVQTEVRQRLDSVGEQYVYVRVLNPIELVNYEDEFSVVFFTEDSEHVVQSEVTVFLC